MNSGLTIPILVLAVATLPSGALLSACPIPQSKNVPSDSDVNAIGHRNVGTGINLFSLDKEKQLGKQLAQEVERSSRLVDDPAVTEYLERIAQNIAKNSDARFPITVRVIDSEVTNAFTLPGGFQYINSELILEAEGEAELAGVLAHGIAHTALRSCTRGATKGEMTQIAAMVGSIFIPCSWAGYATYQGLNLAIPLNFLKFSRDAEREADFLGLQYMYKAGYDPYPCVTLFERLQAEEKRRPHTIPKVFSTHPPTPDRIVNAQKEIGTILPQPDTAIVSSSEFQEVKERLREWKSGNVLKLEENRQKPTLRKPKEGPPTESQSLTPDCD
jgi:predicted Zn-dependent protease